MSLDERKRKILKAVIQNYLETGEPVGSRTISKYTDLNLSSATIRNEMSDLEELGFIFQPHTSSGRIPTDRGYRFYVDELMNEKDLKKEEEDPSLPTLLTERVDRVETMLKQMAKLLATNTNYASLVSAPAYRHTKLKFLQLSKVEEKKILAVIMVGGNIIKNTILDVETTIKDEDLLKLNVLLNGALSGLDIHEIDLGLISELKKQSNGHSDLIDMVLEAIAKAITGEDDEPQIYTSGTTNIFKYPELSDGTKASEIINAFEEKKQLNELITTSLTNANQQDIQIYIGEESPVTTMKDCSVIVANYELGDGITGVIGIVGPKRMDYQKVVGTIRTMMGQLDEIYHRKGE